MRAVTFTEFREDTSALFSAVENGEAIQIIRHDKPIADIIPFRKPTNQALSWKKKRPRRVIKGEELSSIILKDRGLF